MTTTVRYFAPLVWQGTSAGVVVRQASSIVWSQQSVNAYLRNLQAVQWIATPTPVNMRRTTALQWTQDPNYVGLRRVTALQWTQDALVAKLRNVQAVTWTKQPTQGALRRVDAFTLQQSSTLGQLRSISAFTLQLSVQARKTGGLAGLWALIQADAKQTLSQSQLTVSSPVVDATQLNCNTYVTVAPAGTLLQQYSGSTKLYYNRTDIANAFLGGANMSWLLPAITSNTTIRALISAVNTAYGLALDPTDVVDGPVLAGAVTLLLTADSGSYVYQPGTTVFIGNQKTLSSVLTTQNLPGFTSVRGNLVDPPLSSAITNLNLDGFESAVGGKPIVPFWDFSLVQPQGNVSGTTTIDAATNAVFTGAAGATVGQTIALNGDSSLLVSGSNYFSTPHNASVAPGTGDFTIESWIYITNIATQPVDGSHLWPIMFWGNWFASGQPINMAFYYAENTGGVAGGSFSFVAGAPYASDTITMNGVSLVRNVWHHIAMVRKSGVITIYVDGQALATTVTDARNIAVVTTQPIVLGRAVGGNNSVFWYAIGAINRFRFSKMARYTKNFTPTMQRFNLD